MNEARKKCENDANCVFAKCKNFVKIFLGKNNSAKTINVIAATIDFAKRFFLFAANRNCDWLSHARPVPFPFPLFLFPGKRTIVK